MMITGGRIMLLIEVEVMVDTEVCVVVVKYVYGYDVS